MGADGRTDYAGEAQDSDCVLSRGRHHLASGLLSPNVLRFAPAQPLIMSAAGLVVPCRHAILRITTINWLVLFASNASAAT